MSLRPAFILLGAVFLLGTARAQDKPPTSVQVWIDAGLGYGGAGGGPETERGGHMAGRMSVRFVFGRTLLITRATATTGGPSPYASRLFSSTNRLRDEFVDVGLLVGYRVPLGIVWEAYGAGGLGIVSGTRAVSNNCFGFCWTSGTRESFTPRPGLPLEVGLSAALSRFFRLGVVGYANINTEETFGGGLVSLAARLQ